MAPLSAGIRLAWRLAAAEAARAGYEFVQPEHLLIGICKLPGPANKADDSPQPVAESGGASFQYERAAVEALFNGLQLDRAAFYRELRRRIGVVSPPAVRQTKLSRSARSKAAFAQAQQLASGMTFTNVLHLTAALLDEPGEKLAKLLHERNLSAEVMKAAALRAASACSASAPAPRADSPVELGETLDATVVAFDPTTLSSERYSDRLSLLYELPLQLATATQSGVLLQRIVEKLIDVIPGARRGALLLVDSLTGNLVLGAHAPEGEASASLTLAQRALSQRKGFIWNEREPERSSSILGTGIRTCMYAPLLWEQEMHGVLCVDSPEREGLFSHSDLQLLMAVARYAAMAVAYQRAQEELRRYSDLASRLFSFRFPPQVRANLLRAAATGSLTVGTRQSHVTVLVSDIRGFSELTSLIGAQRMNDLLNEYFPPLISAIHAHQGTIELFVGDAIFAAFGSPEPDDQQHVHAVRAALAMQAASTAVMAARAARKAEICEIGIGLDCGDATHGFIGNAERLEYTVIGKPANSASRYCHAAAKGEILISPELHARVFSRFRCERTEIATKDNKKIPAFRVLGEVEAS